MPAASGQVQTVPESEKGMKLEAICVDMHYDKASGQFLAEERKTVYPNSNTDPYAANAFTLHRTIDTTFSHHAYFDIRSRYLRKILENEMGEIRGISWTASPLRVRVYPIFLIFLRSY